MNYEPGEESVLNDIIPKYMSSLIYGALLEAAASENGARMTAMDSATSNAEEMIEALGLAVQPCKTGCDHSGTDRNYCWCECDQLNADRRY